MSEPTFLPAQLAALLERDEQPLVIDVRKPEDLASAAQCIPTARWADPHQVEEWSKHLPRDKHVVVYCVKGGSVGERVASYLSDRGFEVTMLAGGIRAWVDDGLPTATRSE